MTSSVSGGGIGLCGMLAVLFIGLKLTHYIDWSWWWVLAPLWVPPVVILSILAVIGVVFLAAAALAAARS